jgi:hypothetical protein
MSRVGNREDIVFCIDPVTKAKILAEDGHPGHYTRNVVSAESWAKQYEALCGNPAAAGSGAVGAPFIAHGVLFHCNRKTVETVRLALLSDHPQITQLGD